MHFGSAQAGKGWGKKRKYAENGYNVRPIYRHSIKESEGGTFNSYKGVVGFRVD